MKRCSLWVLLLGICLFPIYAQSRNLGIINQSAPDWNASDWINLSNGATSLDVGDFKGKVVYLYCFQSWCPGCHSHGFPTLEKLVKLYGKDPDVAFVAIQTSFEGFSINTPKKLKKTAERYKLKIPFGQSGSAKVSSTLMRDYRTGGTPWTIIIDKKGAVRYNDFRIEAGNAIAFIEALKREKE